MVSRLVRNTGLMSSRANSSHPSQVPSDLSRPHAVTVYDVPSVVRITSENANTTCAMNRIIPVGFAREGMLGTLVPGPALHDYVVPDLPRVRTGAARTSDAQPDIPRTNTNRTPHTSHRSVFLDHPLRDGDMAILREPLIPAIGAAAISVSGSSGSRDGMDGMQGRALATD